jgi:hypothetical protein
MASVDEFLNKHPGFTRDDEVLSPDASRLRLEVALLGVSSGFVKFSYMGTDYLVARDDVLDIEEREDASAPGKPVTLSVKRDAPLLASYSISAADLASSLPFSMFRAPAAPLRGLTLSPRELEWARSVNYEYPPLSIYLRGTGTQTLTGSGTDTGGTTDDSGADDERADY